MLGPVFSIDLLSFGNTIRLYSIDAITYVLSAFFILKLHWAEPFNVDDVLIEKEQSVFQSIFGFFL
ncbi:hypothetical protein ACFOUV_18545 [Oceanobacillus longus]|uniref:Uncharacterized protein n=1 Tax=Oceanobacillus longus TaxID=930120 RepID=A0ABV8H613_9BACI